MLHIVHNPPFKEVDQIIFQTAIFHLHKRRFILHENLSLNKVFRFEKDCIYILTPTLDLSGCIKKMLDYQPIFSGIFLQDKRPVRSRQSNTFYQGIFCLQNDGSTFYWLFAAIDIRSLYLSL